MKRLRKNCCMKFLHKFVFFFTLFILFAGPVESVVVINGATTYAFVQFEDEDSVLFAIKLMDGLKLYHTPICVRPSANTEKDRIYRQQNFDHQRSSAGPSQRGSGNHYLPTYNPHSNGRRSLNENVAQPHGQIYGQYPLNAFLPPPDSFRQRIIGGYYAQVPKSSNTNIQQYYIPTAQTFNLPYVHPHRPEAPFIPPRQRRHHSGQNSLSLSSIVATAVENTISKEDGKEEGEMVDDDEEIISDQSGSVAAVKFCGLNQGIIGKPTFNDIYDAYNVFSTNDLRELLCRGNPIYNKSFDVVTNNFRKTLVAYPPNNDIVRLLHYAMKSDLLFKEINSDAHEDCELCDAKLTLEHLLSAEHVKMYKAVYNNEPPEVLTLLKPKNYALYIHPGTLNNLKIDAIKEMEKSPEFSTMKCLQNFTLKYKLIHRIVEANFEISHKETFSIDKIFFLRKRTWNPALCEFFANLYTPYDCYGCKYNLPKKRRFFAFLRHVLTIEHLGSHLDQVQFGMICLILSCIKETENGYCFSPKKHLKKRKRIEPPTSSSNVNAKRRKLE
uniref:RRM domain-containing protein n=1 Tax=Panagrolaimus davidi TaxID=227884 RepID=A0A914PU42_9BILA